MEYEKAHDDEEDIDAKGYQVDAIEDGRIARSLLLCGFLRDGQLSWYLKYRIKKTL